MIKTVKYGRWMIEYDLDDGARLSRLCFENFDLITTEPEKFRPPSADYGEYETRPVYGYDDCFPSVDQCNYPGTDWEIPDHGELCWRKWSLSAESNHLIFSVDSSVLPVQFKRILEFNEENLTWKFEVINKGDKVLPFQHVIHPLIKLDDITDIQLPQFELVNNEAGKILDFKDSDEVKNYLLPKVSGDTHMLYMQKVKDGKISWTYNKKLQLEMSYPLNIFPTIGIWWNSSGYPDEDGCRRNECAFEPIPGTSSTLTEAHDEGLALLAIPGNTFSWEIIWNMKSI